MNILIVTDAWTPQVNGVVTTMTTVVNQLKKMGHDVTIIEPSQFFTIPAPSYPEIKLAMNTWKVAKKIKAANPDRAHIVTEGPLGFAALRYFRKHNIPHTSSFHTKFPEYINERLPFVPIKFGYKLVRNFHKDSKNVFVPTKNVKEELNEYGLNNVITWSRGVDSEVFKPLEDHEENPLAHISEKKYICISRVAVEKNLETFFEAPLDGKKIMVGDGPARKKLEKKYPDVLFVGLKKGRELARYYAAADVFVFPSLTDTYGVVMLESLSCGTPVAAFDVTGPNNVVEHGVTGYLSTDISPEGLAKVTQQAESIDPQACLDFAGKHDWDSTTEFFFNNLATI